MPAAFYKALASVDDTSYILSHELKILRVNRAWTRFAEDNGGRELVSRWGRGSFILDAISPDLRDFFQDLYLRAMASNTRTEYDYEMAGAQVRRFRMLMVPVARRFLVVTHALRPPPEEIDDETYERDGIFVPCGECKRLRAVHEIEHWDLVANAPQLYHRKLSHGLCPLCLTHALESIED